MVQSLLSTKFFAIVQPYPNEKEMFKASAPENIFILIHHHVTKTSHKKKKNTGQSFHQKMKFPVPVYSSSKL